MYTLSFFLSFFVSLVLSGMREGSGGESDEEEEGMKSL